MRDVIRCVDGLCGATDCARCGDGPATEYADLYDYMRNEHGLILTLIEMQEIKQLCDKI